MQTPIKSYSKKQLCALYQVSNRLLYKWFAAENLTTIWHNKRIFSPNEIQIIFHKIGNP